MESERIFTETVRDFAKPLFTAAVWKAGLFFIEPDWVDNSASNNKKLDVCLQESYRTAVSQFIAEQTNKDKIPIEKLQNDYLPKTLKGEVCGHLRVSYCLSWLKRIQLLPFLSESLQSTLTMIHTIVESHFTFRAPRMLQENIWRTVKHKLKTDWLDVSLFKKIIIQFFFTPNNPWGRCIMYTLKGGISVAMFTLIVTMVSNAMLNILYISYFIWLQQVCICLRDWAKGIFSSMTPLHPKHKPVYIIMLANLQEPGQGTWQLLQKLWWSGMWVFWLNTPLGPLIQVWTGGV